MSGSHGGDPQDAPPERNLRLALDGFAWKAIEEESSRFGVTVEEFISFAVLYYLADIDSGRLSRRILGSPFPGKGNPFPDAPR